MAYLHPRGNQRHSRVLTRKMTLDDVAQMKLVARFVVEKKLGAEKTCSLFGGRKMDWRHFLCSKRMAADGLLDARLAH